MLLFCSLYRYRTALEQCQYRNTYIDIVPIFGVGIALFLNIARANIALLSSYRTTPSISHYFDVLTCQDIRGQLTAVKRLCRTAFMISS